MLLSHQDLLDPRFVETYGVAAPPKQRYLLKKTVINIDPNKQLSVWKAPQLCLLCLPMLAFSLEHGIPEIAKGWMLMQIDTEHHFCLLKTDFILPPVTDCSGSPLPVFGQYIMTPKLLSAWWLFFSNLIHFTLKKTKQSKTKHPRTETLAYSKGDNEKEEGQTDCWHGQWLREIWSMSRHRMRAKVGTPSGWPKTGLKWTETSRKWLLKS